MEYLSQFVKLSRGKILYAYSNNYVAYKRLLEILAFTIAFLGSEYSTGRGSQYCSHDFQKLLKQYGILSSMSRKGDCWDNAVSESFFGTLKTEQVHGVRYITRQQAKGDIIDYIEMVYNCKRRHSYLGYMNPMEFEITWALKKAA